MFYTVLALARDKLMEAAVEDPAPLTQRFQAAISAACRVAGVEELDLGLIYRPIVSASAEIGRNIYGRATADLEAALRQRAALCAAKEAGWAALRAAWREALSETKGPEEAEAFIEAARRAHAPRRAEVEARRLRRQLDTSQEGRRRYRQELKDETEEVRQQRELSAASRALERALGGGGGRAAEKAAAKAAALAERRRKAFEKARRRWMADPRRTTAELLAGPPPDLAT